MDKLARELAVRLIARDVYGYETERAVLATKLAYIFMGKRVVKLMKERVAGEECAHER